MQITKFKITNYRSLIDFEVKKFDTTTIFYGLNNAGKSNILSALHLIFRRKEQYDKTNGFTSPNNFYEGVIRKNGNNYFNQNDSLIINFSVEVQLKQSEVVIPSIIKALIKKATDPLVFTINGTIFKNKEEYEQGLAEIKTSDIHLNGVKIYDPTNSDGFYFPSLLKADKSNAAALAEAFTQFINPLNDCVLVISNSRDMHPVEFSHDKETKEITSLNFKQFLYKLYLSEKGHTDFENIESVFAAAPFSFGKISFSEINGELEIMVKEKDIRLPIKYLGSGVLQILYIISTVIHSKNKILCLEELEQNLSPKLQGQALRKLQSMYGKYLDQIILSSHSSVFANEKYSKAIHFIEKDKMKTIIAEEITAKLGVKAKAHFIPTTFSPSTFSNRAYTDYQQEL